MNNEVALPTAVSSNLAPPQLLDTLQKQNEPAEICLKAWSEFRLSSALEPKTTVRSDVSLIQAETAETSGSPGQEGLLLELPRLGHPAKELRVSFHPIQEWEGYVIAVHQETFTARLTDLTRGADAAAEEADFPKDDLTDEDRELIQIGGVFRWAIGYQRVGGTRMRASHLVFRRVRWTEEELAAADRAGKELSAKIRWE